MRHWAWDYVGKPWVSGAAGPDGYDCHGVVRAAYRDQLGIDLPVVDADALSAVSVCRAMRDYDYSDWEALRRPSLDFDVVEMSLARRPHHVGLFLDVDGGGVLTSTEGIGVIFQRLTALPLHGWNIVACYRYRRPLCAPR